MRDLQKPTLTSSRLLLPSIDADQSFQMTKGAIDALAATSSPKRAPGQNRSSARQVGGERSHLHRHEHRYRHNTAFSTCHKAQSRRIARLASKRAHGNTEAMSTVTKGATRTKASPKANVMKPYAAKSAAARAPIRKGEKRPHEDDEGTEPPLQTKAHDLKPAKAPKPKTNNDHNRDFNSAIGNGEAVLKRLDKRSQRTELT